MWRWIRNLRGYSLATFIGVIFGVGMLIIHAASNLDNGLPGARELVSNVALVIASTVFVANVFWWVLVVRSQKDRRDPPPMPFYLVAWPFVMILTALTWLVNRVNRIIHSIHGRLRDRQ